MKKAILVIIKGFLVISVTTALIGYLLNSRSKNITVKQNNDRQTIDKENLILPDLQTSKPDELFINQEGDSLKIRFSTSTLNSGVGELRLLGESDPVKEITKATQIIKQKDGKEIQREIGEFIFHPGHNHWHVEKFTQFQLWSLKENKDLDKIVAKTDKMSFCLWDEEKISDQKNSPSVGQYLGDCENKIQGLSSGWLDTYSARLTGQELDITSVKDGNYAIRSVVNPDKKILENNYDNNFVTSYVEIKDGSIRIIEKPSVGFR
ncbi:MAG: lysyl oxidase family protein [Patescibacteria group bacterium]|nr:lysyl oxidase family protein [Patescibacteria group bacterium]